MLNDNIMPFTIISTFFLKEAATRIRENCVHLIWANLLMRN